MAVSPFSASSIPLARINSTRRSFNQLSFSCLFPRIETTTRNFHIRAVTSSAPIISAAATTSVGADVSSVSATPSKSLPFRVGHGFDLHRLEPGYPLIIGGINIPHERGCEAHSDGDVLLHCVVDAILGALGLPDIGQIFPDTDPKWKGCASSVFIQESVSICYGQSAWPRPDYCVSSSNFFYP